MEMWVCIYGTLPLPQERTPKGAGHLYGAAAAVMESGMKRFLYLTCGSGEEGYVLIRGGVWEVGK